MDRPEVIASLRRFAEDRLPAYEGCSHRFHLFECDRCEADLFSVEIQRHPGDEPGDFMGRVLLRCKRCGDVKTGLAVTGLEEPEDPPGEHPLCDCGYDGFRVGMCERWEDWGFFDEGTVVARCGACGALRPLVDTD